MKDIFKEYYQLRNEMVIDDYCFQALTIKYRNHRKRISKRRALKIK